MKKLLLVFAHPDDESFTCGGTVVKYTRSGWHVDLLCLTRGEEGMVGQYRGVSPDELGRIRQKELEQAATILNISSVTFFDYKDGTLAQQNPGELEDKIYRKMLEYVPHAVMTFEPEGISNHPDHRKVSLSTTYAFQKYAQKLVEPPPTGGRKVRKIFYESPRSLEDTGLFGDEPKLYYTCIPESVVLYLQKQKIFPQESFGKPWVGTPDKEVTTVIATSDVVSKKVQALQAHRTQKDDVDRFLSLSSHPLFKQEYFILRMQGVHEVFMGKNDRIVNRL